MMAEYGCDFALWGPLDEAPPTSSTGLMPDRLEDDLPITDRLRAGLLRWASDFLEHDAGNTVVDMSDFDDRGLALSRQLQRELGTRYTVQYVFRSSGPHRSQLLKEAEAEPIPGWRWR